MIPLAVSFRGKRNYIHSIDLCDAIISFLFPSVLTENAVFTGGLSVKFLRPLSTVPSIETFTILERPASGPDVVATFHATRDETSVHGRLVASGENVAQRVEVDENRVTKALIGTESGATFRKDSSISIQEAIVIGARRVLETQDSRDENFRWAVAWIKFEAIPFSLHAPHASLERLALKRGSGHAKKFWSFEIQWDARAVGEIVLRDVRR